MDLKYEVRFKKYDLLNEQKEFGLAMISEKS